jgi:hypothetical protein
MNNITEKNVIALLLARYGYKNLCISNYNMRFWFECDVAMITNSGYFTEFEIKLSKYDYEKDFYKDNIHGNKHVILSDKIKFDFCNTPSRFFFVIPCDLAKKVVIPKHAGLIIFYWRKHYKRKHYLDFKIEINAPRLHNNKSSLKVINDIKDIYRYRYLNLMDKFYSKTKEELENESNI